MEAIQDLNVSIDASIERQENDNYSTSISCKLDIQKNDVLKKVIPTAIADADASPSCGQTTKAPAISTCGRYRVAGDPFVPKGNKSNKVFAMAMGHIASADEVKLLRHNVRGAAREVHATDGIKNNLLSINEFAKEDYITMFDGDEVNIYDARNTKVTVSRGAILQGWRLPEEGLW